MLIVKVLVSLYFHFLTFPFFQMSSYSDFSKHIVAVATSRIVGKMLAPASRTLACNAASNAWQLSFHPVYGPYSC